MSQAEGSDWAAFSAAPGSNSGDGKRGDERSRARPQSRKPIDVTKPGEPRSVFQVVPCQALSGDRPAGLARPPVLAAGPFRTIP